MADIPPVIAADTTRSFGDMSQFLRQDMVDEESRQLRDSIDLLGQRINAAVRVRRMRRDTSTIAFHAAALARGVREHQHFLMGLGSTWQALYELGAYQRDLLALQHSIEIWQKALDARSPHEGGIFDRMERLTCRTLGEGAVLLDLSRQSDGLLGEAESAVLAAIPHTAPSWWMCLRGWWRRVRH